MRLTVLFWGILAAFAAMLTAGSCARVVPPTGGPKDSAAPTLVRSTPLQGSNNFKGKVVTLEFSENIAVSGLNQQLIISPVQDNLYTYKIKRNQLILTFEKPFPDSATVFMNFRAGVTDINEKLAGADVRLAFATGASLDTILVSGIVKDLLTSKVVDKVTVGLWPVSDSTDIRKQRPQYLAQTDPKGIFRLENIRKGTYELAAWQDNNGNAKWSGKREPLAFLPVPFTVLGDTNVPLILSNIDEERPRLDRASAQPKNQVEARFNEGLTKLDAFLGPDSLPRQPIEAAGNQYRIYLPKAWEDTLALRLRGLDSAGNLRDTIVRIAPYKAPRNARPDTGKPPILRTQLLSAQGGGSGVYLPGTVTLGLPEPLPFSAPPPTFTLRPDTLPKTLTAKGNIGLYRNSIDLPLPYSTASQYTLYVPEGIKSTTGLLFKPDTLPIPIVTEEQVGLIRGRVASTAKHTILELMDDHDKVLRTLYDAKDFELLGLTPANYILRLTIDANGNRKRDPGIYSRRIEPETVLPPTLPIQVKANWEVEVGPLFEDKSTARP